MALHDRYRPRTPAFVGGRKFGSAAEREGGNNLDRKSGSVIVVNTDDQIRLGLRHPGLGLLEAREYTLPVRLIGLVVVDRRPDGRHVR